MESNRWYDYIRQSGVLPASHRQAQGMQELSSSSQVKATPRGGGAELTIRRLATLEEYQECVRLQEITWGSGFPDLVPSSVLLVTQKIGGIVAGAFDDSGTIVGFVFGMTGYRDGRPVHWSDMLAVLPERRNAGVGTRLKFFQRTEMLKLGVTEIFWTFDPLAARNANFSLVVLGATIESYIPDMYVEGGGDLHRGLGMDRCIATWSIQSPRVEAIAAGVLVPSIGLAGNDPVVNTGGGNAGLAATYPDVPALHIEIPADIHAIRNSAPMEARRWRESTRRAFQHYLQAGYHVSAFVRNAAGNRFFYLLVRA